MEAMRQSSSINFRKNLGLRKPGENICLVWPDPRAFAIPSHFADDCCLPDDPSLSGLLRRRGRDTWDQDLFFKDLKFKMVCLQFLSELSSWGGGAGRLFNLLYEWFLGLSAEEPALDRAIRCRFWARLGAEGF